jgi:hypothetical protein
MSPDFFFHFPELMSDIPMFNSLPPAIEVSRVSTLQRRREDASSDKVDIRHQKLIAGGGITVPSHSRWNDPLSFPLVFD